MDSECQIGGCKSLKMVDSVMVDRGGHRSTAGRSLLKLKVSIERLA